MGIYLSKKDLPRPLQKYWGYEFSTGTRPGQDYLAFQAAYGRWLKKLLPDYRVDVHRNHYEFSAVITKPGSGDVPDRHVYMSISDVRFFPGRWADSILVRKMRHAEDWTGLRNGYCRIDKIKEMVDGLFMSSWEDAA